MTSFLLQLSCLLVTCCVWAQPVIINPSFEEFDETGKSTGWGHVVWGVEGVNADEICITTPRPDDAPQGQYVATTKSDRQLLSAWAQGLKDLTPGQWYEVSAVVSCKDLQGQGCHINVEFWRDGISYGCIDSEHLVGTVDWTRQTIRFLAPGPDFNCNISFFMIGGPGEACFDDVTITPIAPQTSDLSRRRVLDEPFWGMFTCFATYLHQYGADMKNVGVHWQRQGTSALAPEQQKIAADLGMRYAMCIDGMPPATDPNDPCYPITNSKDYVAFVKDCLDKTGPTIALWEFFNEPNTNHTWTLPAYSNMMNMAGKVIKEHSPEALVATGGFTSPEIGYVEACLKRDKEKVLDMVLLHPYAVDEALDTALQGLTEACARAGRPDIAVAINETGWATWDPDAFCKSYINFFSEDMQACNVVKMHVQALAYKLSFVTYLGWNDFTIPSDHASNMGLIRVNGTPKPSFHAYKFMTDTIGNRKIADWSYAPDGTRIYRFTGEKPLWVIWNAIKDTGMTLDVGEMPVFPCDMYGTKLAVTPQTGEIKIKAGSEPVYVVAE